MHGGRACAWCGDWEEQHNENGCQICGTAPWETGHYRCDRFYETTEEAEAAFEQREAHYLEQLVRSKGNADTTNHLHMPALRIHY